jgi:hypothetical protein
MPIGTYKNQIKVTHYCIYNMCKSIITHHEKRAVRKLQYISSNINLVNLLSLLKCYKMVSHEDSNNLIAFFFFAGK